MVANSLAAKSSEADSRIHIINCEKYHSELSELITNITANPNEQPALFLMQATMTADSLPESIRNHFLEFYLHGNKTGVLLLSNCPQDANIDEIPTPQGPFDKQSYISESCLAIVAARLGQVFGYKQVDNGALFQNIIPKPGMEHEQSYASSLVELQFHTEQHFHPYMPDYLLLYCLRGLPDATTFFASVRQLDTELDEYYREMLFEPLYRSGIDYIFGNTEAERGNGPVMPVLYGNRNDPFLRYDQDLMVGITAEAQAALHALQSALEKVKGGVCLKSGDLIIVDNRRTVHGRQPFTPLFDGKDRWLQRAKIMRDLDQAAPDIDFDTHIVHTSFALGA